MPLGTGENLRRVCLALDVLLAIYRYSFLREPASASRPSTAGPQVRIPRLRQRLGPRLVLLDREDALKSLLILSFILGSARSKPPTPPEPAAPAKTADAAQSIVIALWIMAASWAVAILAILLDAGLEIVWRALLAGSIVGATELFVRLRHRFPTQP